ncbi:hypothetical protein SH2C18_20880 [Clostridium sediminicola]|uniref:hypothetical protein n=1 Tax=Clostridium sediminicola TaxID=3114879 RepID=UPI0031F23F41
MRNWVYPANPKYYDVIGAFTEEEVTPWPMSSKVVVGDIVYIYSGVPFKQILFKCIVDDIELPMEMVIDKAEKYIKIKGKSPKKKFMMLKVLKRFPSDVASPLTFSAMREHGLKGSIMGPQCLENNPDLWEWIRINAS